MTTDADQWADVEAAARAADAEVAGPAAADQVDGQAPAGQLDQAPPAPSNRDTIAGMLGLFRELACGLLDVTSPRRTLDDPAIERIADACGPVADKYGLQLSAMFGSYQVELQAALVTIPIAVAAGRALADELRAKKAKPIEADQAEAAPTTSSTPASSAAPPRERTDLIGDPFATGKPAAGQMAA